MKKQILTFGATMLLTLGSTTFIGCVNSEQSEHIEATELTYYCPMKCEGEKTYSEEGSCPECGMDLVEVE
ncbi:MAG: hypothetical protein HRT73_03770 [Flavobacteriales bacterium]|nr:hypothetical protein [Flavobacteriales bacterium]